MWLKMKTLKETGAWIESLCLWPTLALQREFDDIAWSSEGKDAPYLNRPRLLLAKPQEGDRKLLLYMALKVAGARFRQTEASN
jgi:hypothetical protein